LVHQHELASVGEWCDLHVDAALLRRLPDDAQVKASRRGRDLDVREPARR
jgi:hypothetical protein